MCSVLLCINSTLTFRVHLAHLTAYWKHHTISPVEMLHPVFPIIQTCQNQSKCRPLKIYRGPCRSLVWYILHLRDPACGTFRSFWVFTKRGPGMWNKRRAHFSCELFTSSWAHVQSSNTGILSLISWGVSFLYAPLEGSSFRWAFLLWDKPLAHTLKGYNTSWGTSCPQCVHQCC